jgi:hypothetical protein
VSFPEAVRERYLDSSEDEGGSTFHATSSNFKIEVPSLSRVRRGFAGLKVVGLERCRVDGVGDEDDVMEQLAGEFLSLCVVQSLTNVQPQLSWS